MRSREQFYIDKTEALEKGIIVFPSIYITGAAATGKTTAVKMLIGKHSDVAVHFLDMGNISADENVIGSEAFAGRLSEILGQMSVEKCWLVVENVQQNFAACELLADFIAKMPENGRTILLGRENLPEAFLPLLWGNKLEIVPQKSIAFSKDEVRRLGELTGSSLNADEVWKCTGGWAGCVDLMFRLASNQLQNAQQPLAEELRKCYEIDTYIEKYIVGSLSDEERILLDISQNCPWINEQLCQEVWGISDASHLLEQLTRKGFLLYDRKGEMWKTAPLFKEVRSRADADLQSLGVWYEEKHFIKEALFCFKKTRDQSLYEKCIRKYYHLIPLYDGMLLADQWKGDRPECIYLRGMQCYERHDFDGLNHEIRKLKKVQVQDEFQKAEILLNLHFVKPDFTLDDWMEMLEAETKRFEESGKKFRLYNILGKSCTYLCGLRSLTGLFSCERKEENQKARIWKKAFGKPEWDAYLLARMDYYLETERGSSIHAAEWDALHSETIEKLAKLYLMGKMQRIFQDDDYAERMKTVYSEMHFQENTIQTQIAEAFLSIHSPWLNEPERLTRWLKYSEKIAKSEVCEENYCILWCMAMGYLMLNQYKKAERLLKYLIPYLKMYSRTRFLAEALYEQAIIDWENGKRGQALQNVIESFYVNGDARYVGFYVSQGRRAKELLEAYEEWNQKTFPESWSRKKKYQYGNVLRMPMADYVGVILRLVRKEARTGNDAACQEKSVKEQLTMMETIILCDIARGLNNSEICEEQNLKLPTVKSHIYSLYKKLGVNSRVQAAIRGKELGIVE